MAISEATLRGAIERSTSRHDLWVDLLRAMGAREVAEIGVYRGDFAARMLDGCPDIERYHMIDPWRHLEEEITIGPGDLVYVPPRETHILENLSESEPAEYVVARDAPQEDSVEVPWAE